MTEVKFDGDELPVWDERTGNYLDPATGEVLPTWDQALDAIGKDDQPWHVARFGTRFDAQGVLAGSKDAARCIGYLTKYLTPGNRWRQVTRTTWTRRGGCCMLSPTVLDGKPHWRKPDVGLP